MSPQFDYVTVEQLESMGFQFEHMPANEEQIRTGLYPVHIYWEHEHEYVGTLKPGGTILDVYRIIKKFLKKKKDEHDWGGELFDQFEWEV